MTQRVTVFDIDGVLADVRHRLRYLRQRPKDWHGFFTHADADPPLAEGFALLHIYAAQGPVVYLTGRPERLRKVTARWLEAQSAPEGELLMRPVRDYRPAVEFKLERLHQLGGPDHVALLIDDDETVCDGASEAGFTVRHADWTPRSRALEDAQEREGRT